MYNSFNPYGQQFQPMPQAFSKPTELVRVNGIDGARAYQMPPNSTAALFDAGNDLMYIKATDGAGFPTIRTFSFTEQTVPKVETNFATKSELDAVSKRLDEIAEEIKNGKQFVSKD